MSGHESKTLGDFRIVREIGSGGQGTVYEARQMSLRDRRCALKVLTVGTGLSAKAVTRFEREAEIAARLDHPNIVPIYGRGEEGGRYYFAMKYIEGATLADVIERLRQQQEQASEREKTDAVDEERRRSETRTFVAADQERLQGIAGFLREQQAGPSEAEDTASQALLDQIAEWQMDDEYFRRVADVIAQVADGLDHAHRQGVIHRDVKPGNVMVGGDGTPVITDFGVATELGGQTLTLTGDVFGTPHYMSPEQITVVKVGLDRRTDVYSLGVTLYELLTLRKPFEGDTREKVYRQILMKEPRPPRKVHANVPRDLETIAQKAMEKDADQRYHSAADLADDLRRYLGNEPIWAKPPSLLDKAAKGLRRNKAAALGIAVGLFVLLTVGVTSHLRVRTAWRQAERERNRANIEGDSADREAYFRSIAVAEQKISDAHIDQAEALLAVCPEQLRSWEWGRLKRLCHLELLTLRRHSWTTHWAADWAANWAANSVAFSPDGQRIASGGWDGVRVWDSETGHEAMTLEKRATVFCVAFSPGGLRIASGSADGTVAIWDGRTGHRATAVAGHRSSVRSVAFSPDDQRIVSGSADGTVAIWDGRTGHRATTLAGHRSSVWSVAFSPDCQRIASGSNDTTVKIWESETGREVLTLKGHGSYVMAVAFSPDGQRIASGSADSTLRIWDARTGGEVMTLEGHRGGVASITFSPDGQRMVSGGQDRTAKVWDAETGREVLRLRGHICPVWSVAFSPDGQRIASRSADGVKVWDATTRREVMTLKGHTSPVWAVSFSPDGQRIASVNNDGTVKVWDAETGRAIIRSGGYNSSAPFVAFSPDGRRIASGGWDNAIKVWDSETGSELLTLKGHSSPVWAVSFSPDGQRIASGGRDRCVRVWDGETGREVLRPMYHSSSIRSVAFSPDGQQIASGSLLTVRIWDSTTRRLVRRLMGHLGTVWSVAFSPDGQCVAAGGDDRIVRVWDSQTGRKLLALRGHVYRVRSVAFSPDGRRIASGSDDRTVRIWDSETGREVMALKGHSAVMSVAFSPDGKRIASASLARVEPVRVWEARPALSASQFFVGAQQDEARALYHLGVIREAEHRDAEGRDLHLRAATLTDPVQRKWAEQSRGRLKRLPWLQSWWPTCRNAMSCFESGHFEAGMAAHRRSAEGLRADDRRRLGRELAARLVGLGESHWAEKDHEAAERDYKLAIEIAPDVLETHYALALVRVIRKLESREYEAAASECANVQGLAADAVRELTGWLVCRLKSRADEHARKKEHALTVRLRKLAFELEPDRADVKNAFASALNSHAWDLLTREDAQGPDAANALPMALRAVDLSEGKDANIMDTLALAHFKTGDATRAVETEEKAIALLPRGEQDANYKEFVERLATFRAAAKKLEPKR